MKKSEAGFSLIGMLVAVAILGIVALIAVPKFTSAMTSANTARVQADLSTLDSAIETYRIENGSDPQSIAELGDYVRDVDSVAPPKGKVYLEGAAVEMPATSYAISSVGTDARATLAEHTATDFYKNAEAK